MFDPQIFFDMDASEEILHEQVEAFIEEGHTGKELISLILRNHKTGIADHVSRILNLIVTKVHNDESRT